MAVGFFACQQKDNAHQLELSGNIAGLKQGMLYVKTVQDSTLVILDSAALKGQSSYQMQFALQEPQVLYLTLDRGSSLSDDNAILFFAEPGKMTVNSSLTHFFADAQITGSENQKLYENYLASKKLFTNKQNDWLKAQLLARQNKQTQKADSLELLLERYQKRVYLNAVNFAVKHKDQSIAPYLALTEVAPFHTMYLDTINQALTPEVKKSLYGKILTEYVEAAKKP